MSPERKKSEEVLLKLPSSRPGVRSSRRGGPATATPDQAPAKAASAKPAGKAGGRTTVPKAAVRPKAAKPLPARRKKAAPKKRSPAAKPRVAKPATKPVAVSEPEMTTVQRLVPPPGPPPIDNRRRDEIINAGLHAFGEVAAVGVRTVGGVAKKLLGR